MSYFAFGIDENRTDKGMDNSFSNEFYIYLPRKAIYNYSLAKEVRIIKNKCQNIFFRKAKNIWNNTEEIQETIEKEEEVLDSITALKWKTLHIKKHAKIRAKQHIEIGQYSDIEPNIAYLSKLVEDAKKNGYRPVMLTMPYHNEYNNYFPKEWLEKQFYQPIDSIKNKYNIPYLDYSSHESISDRYELFLNSDHLKLSEKHIFNTIFQEDLRKLNYIE